MNYLILLFYALCYALLNVVGAALIKVELLNTAVLNDAKDYISLLIRWKVIIGFVIIFIASLVLFKALSLFEFSKVIPISIGINFILTTTIGIAIFNESFAAIKLISLAIILFGIILLSISR